MILRYLTFLLFCLTLVSCADEKAEENTGKQKMPVIDEVVSEAKLEALNGEEIFITKITSNKINVKRGQDGTTITDHVAGEEIF